MYDVSIMVVFSLAALFGVIGLVQLAGPRFLRDAYRHWDYSQRLRVVTGLLDIAAAVLLAHPSVRGWGIALAAILTFGSAVTLLNHRHYACAAAVIVMMAALFRRRLRCHTGLRFRSASATRRLDRLCPSTIHGNVGLWRVSDMPAR